ncbi:macro domain-containing protein [Phthorimaea operculella]|nr:macro domain-containing protein [Phthorimaea operculella]
MKESGFRRRVRSRRVAGVASVEAWGSESAVCDGTGSHSEPPFLYLPAINQRFAIWSQESGVRWCVEAWGSESAVCDSTASHSEPPFLYLPAINQRFAIWQGDITSLEVDAITNSTDESLLQHDTLSDRILQNAGSELKEEIISRSLECRTGEAVVTPGFALRCRHIIHTVCPKYVPKYHTAAETSLHNCYKNVLHKAGEIGARSLALCVLNTPKRNFPPDVAAHIALRTIRRYLEQSSRPQIVVIATSNSGDAALYTALAPLYFPRSDRDATAAAARLRDIGGPCGEPSHPERRIRIIHNPHSHADSNYNIEGRYIECRNIDNAASKGRHIEWSPHRMVATSKGCHIEWRPHRMVATSKGRRIERPPHRMVTTSKSRHIERPLHRMCITLKVVAMSYDSALYNAVLNVPSSGKWFIGS